MIAEERNFKQETTCLILIYSVSYFAIFFGCLLFADVFYAVMLLLTSNWITVHHQQCLCSCCWFHTWFRHVVLGWEHNKKSSTDSYVRKDERSINIENKFANDHRHFCIKNGKGLIMILFEALQQVSSSTWPTFRFGISSEM